MSTKPYIILKVVEPFGPFLENDRLVVDPSRQAEDRELAGDTKGPFYLYRPIAIDVRASEIANAWKLGAIEFRESDAEMSEDEGRRYLEDRAAGENQRRRGKAVGRARVGSPLLQLVR